MSDALSLYQAAQQALRDGRNEEARGLCQQLIADQPTFSDGHFLLAMTEVNAGRPDLAIGALENALRLAGHAEYLVHYAKCLVLLKRDSEALAAADRATLMQPADALSLDTLAGVYTRLGSHDKAVGLYQLAVKQKPKHAQMRFNLATSLGFLGRFDEAARHYEEIIAANPQFIPAHCALSNLRKQSSESNHIARLTTLLAGVQDGVSELHVAHALAKECEDLGDYDSAFRYLDATKRRRKREVGYDIETDRRIFERLTQRFAQADYFVGASEVAEEQPIFVIGLPRTGTTLTERILSSHPDVESAGELMAMPRAVKHLSGLSSRRRALDADIIDAVGKASTSALGRHYLELSAPHRRTNLRFIDKLPLNFLYVGFILRALPHAKIVCLRRHPLDSVWSNYKHLFATTDLSYYNYSYDALDSAIYYVLFDRLLKYWRQLFPGKILELQYESIVESLESESRRLLAHCELPWTDECLRFHENDSAVATPSGPQVRRPIYNSSIGRWRSYEKYLAPARDYLVAQGVAV